MKLIANRYEFNPQNTDSGFIGQGGMGTVYLGTDRQTSEQVAIKLLKPEVVMENPDMVRRFRMEGEALRQLNHPNIVKMLAMEEDKNHHYLVMEYVGGGSLRDVLEVQPKLSIQRTLYIALDLADALTRAHRLKILHRDIKPANVLLAEDGTPRLTDFGMARFGDAPQHTQEGAIVGTLAYLSPEALNAEDLDERTDIWAFGVMLYEMLSGQRPFDSEQMGPLVNSIMTQPVPDLEALRPDAPIGLIDLIYRMLRKNRDERVPSVRLIGADLEALLRGETTTMQYIVTPETTGRFDTPTPSPVLSTSQILPPHKLPPQTTPFIGREDELAELDNLLNDRNVRLVTLLGPGGMGKTRLALAVADSQKTSFADGIYFVPLAPVDKAQFIIPTINDHIEFSPGGADDPKTQLINYLREKAMLIILDNFEHLTDSAGLLGDILQAAPQVKIIVTSRERLRLSQENVFDVGGMKLPGEKAKSDVLETYAVVQLFISCARRVVPDFTLTPQNARSIARIVHMVQGMPLGVELAAGWLETIPVEEVASEIERSLDFLETDLRNVPERHRSLRAVFEYSWNLMTGEERDVFMKMSVFKGGFEREAVQKVTGASLRALTTLVNKSLLRRTPTGRYEVNKMLRQYAEEHFNKQCNEREDVYKAHAMYYAAFIKRLEPTFDTKHELDALTAMEVEFDNLRAAWDRALSKGIWEALDNVLHPVMLYFQNRSLLREGVQLFQELGDTMAAQGEHNNRIYWRVRIREAWLLGRMGDYQLVYDLSLMALNYFRQNPVGDELEIAYTLNNMSYAAMMMGQYDVSIEDARQALVFAEKVKSQILTPYFMSMGNMGYAFFLKGDYAEARRIYENLNSDNTLDDYSPGGRAYGLNNLGEILRQMGELERARELFQEAYDIFKTYQQSRGMAFTRANIAGIVYQMSDFDEARRMYQEAYELNREIGDRYGLGHSISALGNLAQATGQMREAEKHFKESLAIRREIGDRRGIADSLFDLAAVAAMLNKVDDAKRYSEESIAMRREMGEKPGLAISLAMIGIAMIEMGLTQDARAYLEEGYALGREIVQPWAHSSSAAGLARFAVADGNLDLAAQYASESLQIAVNAQMLQGYLPILHHAYVPLFTALGQSARALELVTLILQSDDTMRVFFNLNFDDLRQKQQALAADLTPDEAQAAIARGQQLTIEQTIKQLVKEQARV